MRVDRIGPAVPIAVEPDEFRRIGRRLVDRIADHLSNLPSGPVTPGESPETVRSLLGSGGDIPEEGVPAHQVLEEVTDLLLDHSLFNGHPRFFGYITSAPSPLGMLGDFLASAVNPNVGAWTLAPMATEIESQTVQWIADLIGYPKGSGGLLVSGGNVANYVGVLAARASVGKGWEIRKAGLRAGQEGRLTIYCSSETHTWIEKAADLFGLGTDSIRLIPADGALRMNTGALEEALARDRTDGNRPFLVVGTAGSTSTGAVDPLPELARICREEGLWFHVDGAYGGFAALVPGAPEDLAGIAQADSVAVDPHKWLYSPLEAGCAIIRDPKLLRDAFSYHPPYYHFGVEATNFVDLGPQNSRGFKALKVWMGIRQVGCKGYRSMISQDMDLARHLYAIVEDHPEFAAMTQGLSVTTFRYIPQEMASSERSPREEDYLDRLNKEIQVRLERGGEAFLSNAVVHGLYCLRACIVNFNTTLEDVEALPEIIARVGREVHREVHVDEEREVRRRGA